MLLQDLDHRRPGDWRRHVTSFTPLSSRQLGNEANGGVCAREVDVHQDFYVECIIRLLENASECQIFRAEVSHTSPSGSSSIVINY
jgi:hypothetical protein